MTEKATQPCAFSDFLESYGIRSTRADCFIHDVDAFRCGRAQVSE